MRPAQLAVLVALVFTLARGLPVPVLDEETWLDIASQASLSRPYDWWRAGPPWGDGHEASGFVFAHPPLFFLWVKLCASLTPHLSLLRIAAAAPFAALLGLSVGALAEGGPRSTPAALAALSSPVLMLAAGCGLMPDLAVTALMTASVVAWLRGWEAPAGGQGWWLASGALLALAAFTKYPALLLAPVLLLDALRRGGLRRSGVFWLAFLVPWVMGEGWLALRYGRVHLVEVLARSGEIPRGPISERALGALARLGLALSPALLGWASLRRLAIPAFLLGGGALALGWQADLSGPARALLLALAVCGGAWVAFAADLAARGWRSVGPERHDTFALAGLGLVVVLGVILGHNYASPRYLLPALAPLTLLAARGVSSRQALFGAALGLVLGLALSRAEERYAVAADQVAMALAAGSPAPGRFSGEWTFRWRMSKEGWTFLSGAPRAGERVALPANAAPGLSPQPGWTVESSTGAGRGSLRLLDLEEGVGWYAETLGALPLGWRDGRLEEGSVWLVP